MDSLIHHHGSVVLRLKSDSDLLKACCERGGGRKGDEGEGCWIRDRSYPLRVTIIAGGLYKLTSDQTRLLYQY